MYTHMHTCGTCTAGLLRDWFLVAPTSIQDQFWNPCTRENGGANSLHAIYKKTVSYMYI